MRFIAPTLLLASFISAVPHPHFGTPVAKRAPVDYRPAAVAKRLGIKDPFFVEQWSLHSLNVPRVWEELKFTGKGVLVAVVDDGLMYRHKDLRNNFDERHSFDFLANSYELPSRGSNSSHGTACAGIIAAEKNNLCGIGIAYNSRIAGIRIKEKHRGIADVVEANALAHSFEHIDIYSCSYGGADPTSLSGPSYDGRLALLNGVNYGRIVWENGNKRALGSIYVSTAGNTGDLGDNCNYNSWATSIYTITIGAVGRGEAYASYSNPCTAVMAVTYSSTTKRRDEIFGLGTSHSDSCDTNFGQTSAAAPAASGIFALALEANPRLTWRDIQHLVVQTAKSTEGYNEYSGFGVLDAYDFVLAAKTWQPVRQQRWIETHAYQFGEGVFSDGRVYGGTPLSKEGVWHAVEITQDRVNENSFDRIEHVQVKVWVYAERRGDIEVTLTSPSNVVSALGVRRPDDHNQDGLLGWTFMSVKHWGESPVGTWWLKINDQFDGHASYATGRLLGFNMMFWGSASDDEVGNLYTMPEVEDNTFPPLGGRHTISVEEEAQGIGSLHSGYGQTWT